MAIIPVNIENLKPNKEYIVTVRSKNNDVNVVSPYTDSVRFSTPTDSTIPGAPTNLVLAASFLNVLFKYTDSIDEDAAKYEYELYKQDQVELISAQYQVISGETPHRTGFVQTNVFVVSVDDNSTTTSTSSTTNPVKYYGRVRTIDTAGNISGWTSIVASGDTPLIDEEFIGSLTAAKITAGTIGAHEIILTQPGTATAITSPDNKAILRSSDYNGSYNNTTDTWTSGTAGWIISGDGRAEFNNIVARGAIDGGTIDIGGSDASSFHVDANGNMWLGNATYGPSAPFRVSNAGALTATGVTVSGQINASSGTFSGNITSTATITGGTLQTASSGQRIVLSGTSFNLYAAGSGDTSTITFNPATTTNYGLITSTGAIKVSAQGATMSIGYYPGDIGTTGVRLESGAYFQVLGGTIDAKRNVTTDWRTANIIARADTSGNASIAFRCASDTDTAQIRVGGGANYFYFRNYNDSANVPIIAGEGLFSRTTTATDVNSANVLLDTSASDVSLGFKASSGTYSAQIRLGGSSALFFADGLNSATGVPVNAASYNIFSDYRLKENFESIINSCDVISRLNPIKFNLKNNPDKKMVGFIAHEIQEHYPFVVTGIKDEVSEDNKPIYQSIDYGMITPLLVSCIQEILKRLEDLENK